MRSYFLTYERVAYSIWTCEDEKIARSLWGDPRVTALISSKAWTDEEVMDRLKDEIMQYQTYNIQYFPIFLRETGQFIGCCGLRPYHDSIELGFHLLPSFWGNRLAYEASMGILEYAKMQLNQTIVFGGHHPDNTTSQKVLQMIGFTHVRDEFYPPTGLLHPLYHLDLRKFRTHAQRMSELECPTDDVLDDIA
ncbi:MAG: GNAT family N-acetyltransferase [Candidatus Heimdallarchaeota archaeon]|nr:GNAT family N-acetyltransferase [Candidatus Heimdallarchaeota archaeon]